MTAYTLFIADVHLQPEADHPINQSFQHFIQEEAPKANALYILGDLFEMWVGDDIGLAQYAAIIHALKELTGNGTPVYLQYGNRDFLMHQAFWAATGIQRLKDPFKVNLYGADYLLLHGDSLCTDDTAYQRMRSVFRSKLFAFSFLKLSQKRRLLIGYKMRQSSQKHSQNKASEIMDVNEQAVLSLFTQHPTVKNMIHGHTHRPEHHTYPTQTVGNSILNRWVLGDWGPNFDSPAKIVKVSAQGADLIEYTAHSTALHP